MLTSPVAVPDAPRNTNAPRTHAVSVYAAPAVTGMVCPHSAVVAVGVPTSAGAPGGRGGPVPQRGGAGVRRCADPGLGRAGPAGRAGLEPRIGHQLDRAGRRPW